MPTLNGIFYLAVAALKESGVSESTIVNSLSQNRKRNGAGAWQHIRPAEVPGTGEHDRRVVWVRVDTIPTALRTKHNLPNCEPQQQTTPVQAPTTHTPAPAQHTITTPTPTANDRLFFETHTRPDGSRTYTDEQVMELMQAAAWLRLAALPAGSRPTIEAIHAAIAAAPVLGLKASSGEAISAKRLFSKVGEWKQKGYACLVSGKLGNSNSRKITEEVAAILIRYGAMPTAFDTVQVWDWYNQIDRAQNPALPQISHSAVKTFLSQPEIQRQVSMSRSGKALARNKYEPLLHRKAPTLAHRLWVIDGTPLDLYYREGNNTWKRAYFFFAVDAANRHIVGAALGTTENQALVRDTLLAAVKYTGYLPEQILADNGSAITATDTRAWLGTIAKYVTFAEPGNARAKVAENTWAQFLHKYLNRFPNYAGGNVTSNSLANREFLTSHKHLIPELAELKVQLSLALTEWNAEHPLPKETEATAVTQDILRDIAWQWRVKPTKRGTTPIKQAYTYTNAGLSFDLDTTSYAFEVRDREGLIDMGFWNQWAYKDFLVKYDPANMDRVALFTEDERFVTYATNVQLYAYAMALRDQQPGEAARRAADLERRKAWRNSEAFLDPAIATALYTLRPSLAGKAKDMTNLAEDVLKTLDLPDYKLTEPKTQTRPGADSLYDDDDFIDPKYLQIHD